MLDLLRAWDLAQEDLLIFAPEDPLASAVEKLLARMRQAGARHAALCRTPTVAFWARFPPIGPCGP